MFYGDSFVGGEFDIIDHFKDVATNDIGVSVPSGANMATAQYGTTAAIQCALANGQYYSIFVYNATSADIAGHLFSF
jgi:hypothetical protein